MITVARTTSADPAVLWSVMSDLDRWGALLPTMNSVRALDPATAPGLGARYAVSQPGLPKAIYTINDWRPGRGFTWVARSPGIRTTATHEIATDGTGTTLTLGVTWSGMLGYVLRPLLTKKGRPLVEQEADTLIGLATSG